MLYTAQSRSLHGGSLQTQISLLAIADQASSGVASMGPIEAALVTRKEADNSLCVLSSHKSSVCSRQNLQHASAKWIRMQHLWQSRFVASVVKSVAARAAPLQVSEPLCDIVRSSAPCKGQDSSQH